MLRHIVSLNRRAAISRDGNEWRVIRQVHSKLFGAWIDQPVALYPSYVLAVESARAWVAS